jgi:hypothetical protein
MKIEGEYIKQYEKTLNSRNSHGCKDDKQYYQSNKEVIKKKAKQYYQANKEAFKQRVQCPHCNIEMNKSSLRRHIKRHH